MSSREWTSLLFKLSGIGLIVSSLVSAPASLIGLITSWELMRDSTLPWLLMVIAFVVPFLLGVALLRRTDWFVDVAFRSVLRRLESSIDLDDLERSVEQSETAAEVATAADAAVENEREEQWVLDFPSLHRDDIQAIALSLMGVWVLASSLPDAFTHVGRYLMYDGDNALGQLEVFFVGGWILPPIHVAARVAVGLCLFFGSYGITKSWSGSQNRVRITAMPDRRDESS